MTVKLYDEDAYRTGFEAVVISCEAAGEKGYAVTLDRTAFFPEEGGQSPDFGILFAENDRQVKVTDVQIDSDITHYCNEEITPGTKVRGQIDWAHRYSNMQQHTGEHIFSGIVHSKLGFDNVGFHLSDNIVTMDYNGPLSDEQVEEFETLANEWIYKNVPVKAEYPDDATLAALDYRSKKELTGPIRIVTIEGVDVCACCAPHVHRTGEVGIFKVISHQSHRGGTRVSALCGYRALDDFRRKQEILGSLSKLLSKPGEELHARVQDLMKEKEDLRQELYAANKDKLDGMVAAIPSDRENVCLFISAADINLVRKTVNTLVEAHGGCCAICVGNDETGYTFILGSARKKAGEAAKVLREKLSAKCGGSDLMIQGTIPAGKESIENIICACNL